MSDCNYKKKRINNPLSNLVPEVPERLLEFIKAKCEEKTDVQKPYYPKRMHALLEAYQQIDINKIMVLDVLVEQGILKPLSERQKKGVFQILFTDMESK